MRRVAQAPVTVVVAAVVVAGAGLWSLESTLAARADVVRAVERASTVDAHEAFLRSLVGLTVAQARDVLDGPGSHAPGEPVIVLRDPRTRPGTAVISAAWFPTSAERVTVEVANRDQVSAADWRAAKLDPAQLRVGSVRCGASSCAVRR